MFLIHWPQTSAGALSQRGVTTMTAKLSETEGMGVVHPRIVGNIDRGREIRESTPEHPFSLFSYLTMKRENGRWRQTDSDTCATSYRVIQWSTLRYFTRKCRSKCSGNIVLTNFTRSRE